MLTRNPRAAALELDGQAVELFAGSHGDPKSASEAMDGISAVYHLAKCDGKQWQDYVDGDIAPTRVLAQAALSAGVKRFIYTGTIASYASGNAHDVIDNNTPVDPAIARRDHYARSKAACEGLLQAMQREAGLPLVILRPGIVIGPGSPPAHPGVGRFLSETRGDYWETVGTRCPWLSWTTSPRRWCSRWTPRSRGADTTCPGAAANVRKRLCKRRRGTHAGSDRCQAALGIAQLGGRYDQGTREEHSASPQPSLAQPT